MLQKLHPGLPTHWYYDPQHYQLELQSIWYQQWICVGRESDWPETGSYQAVELGDQNILVLRAHGGQLNAFHNTCRHRGSILCEQASGKLPQGRIVCPYHAWTYDLEGELQHTPRRVETDDFDASQLSLYRVNLQCWGGFVFICLAGQPEKSLQESLGDEGKALDNWPLCKLKRVHREEQELNCNWKIFWENFLECYHCPGIHPELCKLVPVYGQGFLSTDDLQALGRESPTPADRMLADKAQTWVFNGISGLPLIEGLTDADRARGMTFATLIPSVFVVAHQDYVRSVRVIPLGPEKTRLSIDWLLPEASLDADPDLIEQMIAFARQVVQEDGRACELNQKGLKSIRHHHGVLMPQEYDVLEFNNWVRDCLGGLL